MCNLKFKIYIVFILINLTKCLLYKQENELRNFKYLNGLWKFKVGVDGLDGFKEKWHDNDLVDYLIMPVPSSFNDITLQSMLRNYVGWVWYQQTLSIPNIWNSKMESIHYYSVIFVNNVKIGIHESGHIPFEFDITDIILKNISTTYNTSTNHLISTADDFFGKPTFDSIRITIAINNTLTHDTIPQADFVHFDSSSSSNRDNTCSSDTINKDEILERVHMNGGSSKPECVDRLARYPSWYPKGYTRQTLLFDFFNYAGIHRDITLLNIPTPSIDDITIRTTKLTFNYYGDEKTKRFKYIYNTYTTSHDSEEQNEYNNVNPVDEDLQNTNTENVATVEFFIQVSGVDDKDMAGYNWLCALKISPDERYTAARSEYVSENGNYYALPASLTLKPIKIITTGSGNTAKNGLIFNGSVTIREPKLWWPFTMDPPINSTLKTGPGYMYTVKVGLVKEAKEPTQNDNKTLIDIYEQNFGIRTLEIKKNFNYGPEAASLNVTRFLVNGLPFYFRGFGWHEDLPIVGRGHSTPHSVSDFYRILWLGANSFRTSHYPYDEKVMDLCDTMGIVVINELPAVGVRYFNPVTLKLHSKMAIELVTRDKNRPSTFLWSLANEPRSALPESDSYFAELARLVKFHDPTRFVTAALYEPPGSDLIGKHLDIICINRYLGWYENVGELDDLITPQTVQNINMYGSGYPEKPIIITEYGAETIAGYHSYPPFVFSEEYQVQLLKAHHVAFDSFLNKNHRDLLVDNTKPLYTYYDNYYNWRNDVRKSLPSPSQIIPTDDNFELELHFLDEALDNVKTIRFDNHFSTEYAGYDHLFKDTTEPTPQHSNLVGEMIWNFIDFETPQTITRVGGNRKGIFSRDRSPKMSAYLLRQRYWKLAKRENEDLKKLKF